MTEESAAAGDGPWGTFRSLMPVAQEWAYFDHAAVAPLSEPARKAMADWANDVSRNGDVNWSRWSARIRGVRRSAATMLQAAEEEVALVSNTTHGIHLVAEGYPWEEGDNVVTLADEFPSNLVPWLNLASRGVETRRVPVEGGEVDLGRIEAACDDRTRIVSLSWVGFATGYRLDLDEVAEMVHRRGALLCVDAIQGLGIFPLDVRQTPVDFVSADGHKWLLGPEGAGIFYMRREHLDRLRPLGVGWNSLADATDYDHSDQPLKASAERYEGGSANMAGQVALGANLNWFSEHTTEVMAERLVKVTDRICEALESHGAELASCRRPAHKSGIVAFTLPGRDPRVVRKSCRALGVVLSCRSGRLRVSPHVYTNRADIDRLCAALIDA